MTQQGGQVPGNAVAFRVEYDEVHVKVGTELQIHAPSADLIKIHDVSQVGDEIRFVYTVIWPERRRTSRDDEDPWSEEERRKRYLRGGRREG